MRAMLEASSLVGLPAAVADRLEEYCSSALCRARLARVIEDAPPDAPEAESPRELLRLLDAVPGFWEPFDAAAAEAYGRLAVDPAASPDSADLLLAAQAVSRGLPLATRLPGLFAGIAGLEVLGPEEEAAR